MRRGSYVEGMSELSPEQLQPEDTLDGSLTGDVLDAGYSPPDREPYAARHLDDDSQAERLAEEEPEVWDADEESPDGSLDDGEVGARRAGRLVAPDQGFGEDTESELLAGDVGIDGGAASSEEAAMHVIDSADSADSAD